MALFGRAQIMGGRQTTGGTSTLPYTTNLFAHWDAADTASITDSSGLVDSWADQVSGRLLNGVTTTRPTTNATTRNGHNVIDFDATTSYLTDAGTKADFSFMHNGADSTIFVVCKAGTGATPDDDYGLWGNNAGSSTGIGHYVLFLGDGTPVDRVQHVVTRGVGGSFVTINQTADNYFPANTWLLIEVFGDADAALAQNRSAIYVSNSSGVQNNSSSAADSNSDATRAWQVGALGNNAFPGTIKVAEILIYAEAVTGTNRTDVRNYLASKWSVTV